MKNISVVHVLDSLGVGGLEKGVITLITHSSEGIDHSIICLRGTGEFSRLLPSNIQLINMNKPTGNSLAFIRLLSGQIKSLKPDIVHSRNWSGMDAILAARLAGVKSIVQGEHGWGVEDLNGRRLKRRLVRRLLSLWVSEYVAVSKQIGEWLINEIGITRPVNQIYNGIDSELFSPLGQSTLLHDELGFSGHEIVFGMVARMDPIKNHSLLLEAFERVSFSYPEARLVLVGDGPDFSAIKMSANDKVFFLGGRQDVSDIMRCFDVFVLPSLNEGISNTILEAMSCGVPVIASHVGGNPELVSDGFNGFLFPSNDVNCLCVCLEKYLNDSDLRKEHGECGRQMANKNFTVSRMVDQYEDVWRRICKKNQ